MKKPYVNGPMALGIVCVVILFIAIPWTFIRWNEREEYIDLCITRNYTAENGFPPGLRSFCVSSWRLR